MSDAKCYDFDRNRYPAENMFVGEIENGCRYPYGTYRKEEADEKFAKKLVEAELDNLSESVETQFADVNAKIKAKAEKSEINDIYEVVEGKADKVEVDKLVNDKAGKSEVDALSRIVESKADESETVDIRRRLDGLEEKSLEIISFTATPKLMELGSSNTVTLNWEIYGSATSQTIDGEVVTGTSKQYDNVESDRTFSLSVTDDKTTKSKSVSVCFANQIYYGTAENLSNVTSLSKTLSNEKTRTINVDAGEDQYIIYAIPSRLGYVRLFVNGFEGGFERPQTLSLTNENNFTESYNVYVSNHRNLGTTTIEVKEY